MAVTDCMTCNRKPCTEIFNAALLSLIWRRLLSIHMFLNNGWVRVTPGPLSQVGCPQPGAPEGFRELILSSGPEVRSYVNPVGSTPWIWGAYESTSVA